MHFRLLILSSWILFLSACSSINSLAAPGNVSASATSEGVRVSWEDKSQDELGFTVYREVAGTEGFTRLANVPVDTQTFLDTNVRAGASYRYAVSARGVNGESAKIEQSGEAVKFTAPKPNTPPEADAQNATTPEDTAVTLRLSGSDDDGDELSYLLRTQPEHGTLSDFDPLTGSVTYIPETDYVGTDSFGFSVSDGEATSLEVTVNLDISAVNDAPVALPQTLNVTEEVTLSITLTATDAEGDTLTYAIATEPQSGTLSTLDAATGQLTYTPDTDFSGRDSFTFSASDGKLSSGPATVTINVGGSNDAPVIEDVADLETGRAAQTLNFTVSDPDGDTLTVSASSSNEAVVANPLSPSCSGTTCTLSFTPAGPGTTTMTLSVEDEGGLSTSDTFEVSVFDVDKLVTNPANSGVGSLRQIIDGLSSGETVGFGTLGTSTITLTSSISTNRSFSLLGPGSANLTISGGDTSQILLVTSSAKVTLKDITLALGRTDLDGGCLRIGENATVTLAGDLVMRDCTAGDAEQGGGVMNYGTLAVTDSVVVRDNKAKDGGGIYNRGTLTLSGNSSVSQNEAKDDGGAVYNDEGSVTMSGQAKLTNNIASDKGGGIYLLGGSLTMSENALVTLNRADADNSGGGTGGGVYNNDATLTGVTADGNVTSNTPDQIDIAP